MRTIQLHKQATKFIASVPPKQQRQIATALVRLQMHEQPHDSKKLHGYDYYRIDCGEYRVIYNWNESVVFVYIIGKRNDGDVYRKLKRSSS
jgi:mRNA interferase RelE/StbE